jgi:hypothetical protein
MSEQRERVSAEETDRQVRLMARRMALMYHHIGEVLTEELGKDMAKELLKEAIWRYGSECGENVREAVLEQGLPLTIENYSRAPDLPEYGWVSEPAEKGPRVLYCPLAEVWLEKDSTELGRLYCYVDQAKYQAYNDVECVHLKNLQDGDDCCLFSLKEAEQ